VCGGVVVEMLLMMMMMMMIVYPRETTPRIGHLQEPTSSTLTLASNTLGQRSYIIL